MADWTTTCWSCGTTTDFMRKFGRTEECPSCYADLSCCKNCKFYDEMVSGKCTETQAEYVGNKEKANFCDYFKPGAGAKVQEQKSSDEALAALNSLFKD